MYLKENRPVGAEEYLSSYCADPKHKHSGDGNTSEQTEDIHENVFLCLQSHGQAVLLLRDQRAAAEQPQVFFLGGIHGESTFCRLHCAMPVTRTLSFFVCSGSFGAGESDSDISGG